MTALSGTQGSRPLGYNWIRMNKLILLTAPTLLAASTLSLKPVKWSLVGGNAPRPVIAGRAIPVIVQADIAKGWHIYSLTQKAGGPIPLSIAVQGARDVSVRGVIRAPKPEKFFDKNFGMTTELYSGSPRFTIPLVVPGRTARGARQVEVTARYQVCSDKLCLPPRTDTVQDRKSTRLNSSHSSISYAVFCLKKKKK